MAPGILVRRNCVTCPSDPPQCSKCPEGKVCSLSVQTCEQCPEAKCISQVNSSISGKSAGAIAGGVVGGLVGIGIIVGIIFWYKFRGRRNRHLQDMKEAALEYDTPPDSPEFNPYDPQDDYDEGKPPSIMSVGAQSNTIPIMFPVRQNGTHSTISPRMQSGQLRGGPTTIRDSIHGSEYSVESEYIPGANNQALRAYDVAVQGLPSLIHVNKPVRPPSGRQTLEMITEGEMQDQGSQQGSESQQPLQSHSSLGQEQINRSDNSETASFRSAATSRRFQRINSNAKLPVPPLSRTSSASARRSLNPNSADEEHVHTAASPFDDPNETNIQIQHEPPANRYSRGSSNEYVADLPEETRLYQGHGYL